MYRHILVQSTISYLPMYLCENMYEYVYTCTQYYIYTDYTGADDADGKRYFTPSILIY